MSYGLEDCESQVVRDFARDLRKEAIGMETSLYLRKIIVLFCIVTVIGFYFYFCMTTITKKSSKNNHNPILEIIRHNIDRLVI